MLAGLVALGLVEVGGRGHLLILRVQLLAALDLAQVASGVPQAMRGAGLLDNLARTHDHAMDLFLGITNESLDGLIEFGCPDLVRILLSVGSLVDAC